MQQCEVCGEVYGAEKTCPCPPERNSELMTLTAAELREKLLAEKEPTMIQNGIIWIDGKKYGAYQYDIVKRPYDAINDKHNEEWGWKFTDFTGNVAISEDKQMAFTDRTSYRLMELE